MNYTPQENEFIQQVIEKVKSYGFYVYIDGRMFYDRESPQEISRNYLKCMLKKDIKHEFSTNYSNRLLDACITAFIMKAQEQIKKQMEP